MVGRLSHFGLRLACQLAAVPLARRDGLVGGGGHVGEHLAEVRAAFCAAHMLVDDFAPARAHGAANEFVHPMWRARTFGVRNAVHRGGDVLNHQAAVQSHADFQAVNRFIALEDLFIGHSKVKGFDIGQLSFNVPQAVFAVEALEHHSSRM